MLTKRPAPDPKGQLNTLLIVTLPYLVDCWHHAEKRKKYRRRKQIIEPLLTYRSWPAITNVDLELGSTRGTEPLLILS